MMTLSTGFTNSEGLAQPWLALWVIAWTAAAIMIVVWPFIVRRRCERLNVCVKCRYSREGSSADVCPECGCAWEAKSPTATRFRLRVSIGMALIGLTGWWVLARWISMSERGAVALVPTWALIEVLDTNPLALNRILNTPQSPYAIELDHRIRFQGVAPHLSHRWGERTAVSLRSHLQTNPEYEGATVEYADLRPLIDARSIEKIAFGWDLHIRQRMCGNEPLMADPYQMDWSEDVIDDVVDDLEFVRPLLGDREFEIYPILTGVAIVAQPEVQEIVRKAIGDLRTLESMPMQADGGINPIIGPIQRDPEGTEWVTVLLNADEPARVHTGTRVLTDYSASVLEDWTCAMRDDASEVLDKAAGDGWFRGTITPINRKLIVLLNPKDLPVLMGWWKTIVESPAPPIEFGPPEPDGAQ